ncbi:hypothetical protein F7734_06170 [Scytonema sp. UIC 10036]|uniref:hypothetical protein n=1 Tax=Scytonema sp. UIC 10036 TaxID=2304196 RepID=UPI0012DA1574|nr:hypothetical protein [Scytonema sp. UIC 10036]MUG92064.1 hypothetical protein [Scytonema sp. UIC 10036]
MLLGGWIVGNPDANPTYAISHVKKSQQNMLWFEIIVGRDSKGSATSQFIANAVALPIPELPPVIRITLSVNCFIIK